MDLLELAVTATLVQLAITVIVASFDIVVVWFGVWIPLRRATPKEDRPYLWKGLADYARQAREGDELERRVRRAG